MEQKHQKKYYVTAFYQFMPLENLEKIKADIEEKAQKLNIIGLLILGNEGINSTCSAQNLEDLNTFKSWLLSYFDLSTLNYKDSIADSAPFRFYKVKIRNEIVTLGNTEISVDGAQNQNHHLSPEEWNQVLKEEKDVVLLDTRNWYETQIGTFKNAITPGIDKFTEFCDYVDNMNLPKDKKMLIFCTGGIRCEKGIYEMQRRGYENVYQLEGGILNYLKEKPNDQFEGECFVFDHRVAVDQNLAPSLVYDLCPHCGQPAKTEIQCKRCDTHQKVCDECLKIEFKQETCSKNCAYQYELHPDRKAAKQLAPWQLQKE